MYYEITGRISADGDYVADGQLAMDIWEKLY